VIGDAGKVEAAIREHQRVTGYLGPVVVVPRTLTPEEWSRKYAHLAAGDAAA
jgi:hypothetical protein